MPTLHYQEREGLQITLYNAPACPKLQIAELRPAESHRVTSLTKLLNHTDSLTSTYFFKFLSELTRLLISEPLPPGQLDLSRDAHAPARILAHGHARGHELGEGLGKRLAESCRASQPILAKKARCFED